MAPQVSGNPDINMYVNQIQGLFGQIGSNMGGDASTYINSVWNIGSNIQGLTSEDDQQKASAIQGLMNNVMSLINKLASNEAQAARQEVKRNGEESKKLNKTIEEQNNQLTTEIDAIGGEIDTQTGIVNTAIGQLTDTQKAIQEQQEEINKIIAEIQKLQNELASTTDPTKQAELLLEIQGLSANITTIISSISDLQSQVETASSTVENAVEEIETAKGNALEVQQTSEAQITENAQKSAQLTQTTIKSNTEGTINTVTGAGLEATAEAASSNMFTAGTAPELYRKANDQQSAGTERTTGALTNLQTIMQGIGGLNNNASLLSHFENAVGGALKNFDASIIGWNDKLEPVITSFGSFSTIEGEIQTLDTTVKEDLSRIPEDSQKAGGHLANHQRANDIMFSGLGFPMRKTPATQGSENSENVENTSGLKTPDVKLTAFEIEKP